MCPALCSCDRQLGKTDLPPPTKLLDAGLASSAELVWELHCHSIWSGLDLSLSPYYGELESTDQQAALDELGV